MSDEQKEKTAVNEAMRIAPACPNGQLYTVKPGDTLFQIARRFNVSLQNLINANPQITNPNLINPGQMICIPTGRVDPGLPCPGGGVTPAPQCPGGWIYRVVAGDTMYTIANRHGISLDALLQANPQISDANLIFPGQEICIPGAPVPCPNGVHYTVMAGDTLFEIARRNNLPLSALIAANPQITDADRIFPGQVICIPRVAAVQPPAVVPPVIPPVPTEPPATMPPVGTPLPCPPGRPGPIAPISRPCPPGTGEMPAMYQPLPVYVVVPWEECPYRPKKKKRDHKRGCK
ncbi:MAG TPA: LysM peptidoglycan-binding domain-containing protein [Bacillota bacterium]